MTARGRFPKHIQDNGQLAQNRVEATALGTMTDA
jgi:hypothetical protein